MAQESTLCQQQLLGFLINLNNREIHHFLDDDAWLDWTKSRCLLPPGQLECACIIFLMKVLMI